MAKKDNGVTFKTIVLFLLIVVVSVLAYLSGAKKNTQQSVKTPINQPTPTVQKTPVPGDLDQAQDQLNTVNIDSVDSGINQINSQVSSF